MAGTDVADPHEPRRAGSPARWEAEYAAEPELVAVARRGVTAYAVEAGLPEIIVGDIALAVSEAATNAVVHAFVDRVPGRLLVVAEAGEDVLQVRVIDDGRGMIPRSDSPGLGLGLPTIGQLTESFDVRHGPGGVGTEVRMVFAAPGLRPGPSVPEDGRVELLAQVTSLTNAGWPRHGVEDLVDLLVPRVADACALDLIEHGVPQRLAARVAGDHTGELTAWLAARRPPASEIPAMLAQLVAGQVSILALDEQHNRDLARDDAELQRMQELELSSWVNVPLADGDVLLGTLGLGFRASRPRPDAELPFLTALGERAARGLANTRLVEELQRTRGRLEGILAALSEAVTVHDDEGRVVYANEAAARLLGAASVAEVLATPVGALADRFTITREDGSPVRLEDLPGNRLVAGREAEPLLTRSVHKATGVARWVLTKATLMDDEERLAVNIIEDVTEAKEAELRQRFLSEAGVVLASTLDLAETLEHVARLAIPSLADWCVIDLVSEGGSLERVALVHADPAKVEFAQRLRDRYPADLEADQGLGAVLRTGEPQLYGEITGPMLDGLARDGEHARLLREVGMRSAALIPMRGHARTVGVLSLITSESGRAFDEHDVQFASELAWRAGMAVENAWRYGER